MRRDYVSSDTEVSGGNLRLQRHLRRRECCRFRQRRPILPSGRTVAMASRSRCAERSVAPAGINRRINNMRGQADVYVELGNVAKVAGDDMEVREFWGEAVSIYRQLNLQARVDNVGGNLESYLRGPQ